MFNKFLFNLSLLLPLFLLSLKFPIVDGSADSLEDDTADDTELLTQLMQFINRNQNLTLHVLNMSERLNKIELTILKCEEKIHQFENILMQKQTIDGQQSCASGNESSWIVIQRRKDGSIDFYRTWNEYKGGFGDKNGEFFIGLETLHQLTYGSGLVYELSIEMETFNGEKRNANFNHFVIGSESENYILKSLGRYHGNAGDSFNYHLGQWFSTKDRRNDQNPHEDCAKSYEGGWWYNECHQSNLNGRYYQVENTPKANGIHWYKVTDYNKSLKFVEMKIRPKLCQMK